VKAGYVDEARAKEILDTTLATAPKPRRTYDDKPKWTSGPTQAQAGPHRDDVAQGEPTAGTTASSPSRGSWPTPSQPYVDQDGESYCPWVLESANVDRENNRYGESAT
jgi:hypothetical protein